MFEMLGCIADMIKDEFDDWVAVTGADEIAKDVCEGIGTLAVDAAKKGVNSATSGVKNALEYKQRYEEGASKLTDERLLKAVRNTTGSSMEDTVKRGAYIRELKNRGYTYDDVK